MLLPSCCFIFSCFASSSSSSCCFIFSCFAFLLRFFFCFFLFLLLLPLQSLLPLLDPSSACSCSCYFFLFLLLLPLRAASTLPCSCGNSQLLRWCISLGAKLMQNDTMQESIAIKWNLENEDRLKNKKLLFSLGGRKKKIFLLRLKRRRAQTSSPCIARENTTPRWALAPQSIHQAIHFLAVGKKPSSSEEKKKEWRRRKKKISLSRTKCDHTFRIVSTTSNRIAREHQHQHLVYASSWWRHLREGLRAIRGSIHLRVIVSHKLIKVARSDLFS